MKLDQRGIAVALAFCAALVVAGYVGNWQGRASRDPETARLEARAGEALAQLKREQEQVSRLRSDTAKALVAAAKAKATLSISKHAAQFAEQVRSRKAGARAFSEEVFSASGKWKALCSYLPGTPKDCHKHYLSEQFGRHVFEPEQFNQLYRNSIEAGLRDIVGAENELAVALRGQVLGRALNPEESRLEQDRFRGELLKLASESGASVDANLKKWLATEVAREVASGITLLPGLAVAASNPFVAGGLLVAFIAYDVIRDQIYSPAAEIELKVRQSLDDLAANGAAGSERELTKMLAARAELWERKSKEYLS